MGAPTRSKKAPAGLSPMIMVIEARKPPHRDSLCVLWDPNASANEDANGRTGEFTATAIPALPLRVPRISAYLERRDKGEARWDEIEF